MSGVRFILIVSILGASVLAGACSSNSSPAPAPTGPATTVTMPQGASTMTTTAYSPNPVNVTVGTTVRWSNADSTIHTATADGGMFSSGNINVGSTFDFKFNAAGTFTYKCTIHPNMVGTVVVQ
jgi:plastocyanin